MCEGCDVRETLREVEWLIEQGETAEAVELIRQLLNEW